jgi:hypothetical protein
MNRFLSLRLLSFLMLGVAIFMLTDRAAAAVRPHFSRGTAKFVSPTDFIGSGYATHLGVYSEVGSVAFSPTTDPDVLRLDGRAIYTAANGDQLRANFTGRLNRVTGAITATLTYVGGTGRFASAKGSASLTGQMLPGGIVTVTVSGTIDY